MIVHSLHPIDAVLAEVGMMGRRAKAGTLTPAEFHAIEPRIRRGLAETGADPAGVVGAMLDGLVLSADAESLNHLEVERAAQRMRERLVRTRDGSLPLRPNFAVLPSGIHGRRLPLTVLDGGRGHTPQPHKGA